MTNTAGSEKGGTNAALAINNAIEKAVYGLHRVGTIALIMVMVLTTADIIGRKFNHPILGAFDITSYLMAILVAFSLAYCGLKKGHVEVDFVVRHMPERATNILAVFTTLIGVFVFVLVSWQTGLQVISQYNSGIISSVLPIPQYPFVGAVALGSAFLALVLIVDFIKALLKAAGAWTP